VSEARHPEHLDVNAANKTGFEVVFASAAKQSNRLKEDWIASSQ
jgi:hypothetical protein